MTEKFLFGAENGKPAFVETPTLSVFDDEDIAEWIVEKVALDEGEESDGVLGLI